MRRFVPTAMTRACVLLVSIASVPALVACGDEAETTTDVPYVPEDLVGDDEAAIVVETLSATLGPEGGVIEGDADGAFAGFRLEVPAGALSESVEITVSGVADPTPLAQTAARVGPQFALAPDGLTFATPALLTVPFDADLRLGWDVPDSDCRVWYRAGDGWSNAEQTTSTEEGVTVELPGLTTVAAGVFAIARVPFCQTQGNCPPTIGDQGCLDGDGFCLTRLVPPPSAPFDYNHVTVDNGNAYYLNTPSLNRFQVVTYDLLSTNGATTTSGALAATPSRSVQTLGRIAVEPNGNLWLGMLGYGNVRFRPTSSATRFDTSTSLSPQGALFVPSMQRIMRFTLETSGSGRAVRGTATNFPQFSIDVASVDKPISVLGIRQDVRASRASFFGEIGVAAPRAGVFPPFFSSSTRFDDPCGTSLGLPMTFDISNNQLAIACSGNRVYNGFTRELVEPGHAISSLAIDDQNNIFVVDATIAQISRIDPLGGVTTVALSSAAPGTPDYDRMLPRAIRYEDGIDMLVLFTRGNNSSGAPDIFLIEGFRD